MLRIRSTSAPDVRPIYPEHQERLTWDLVSRIFVSWNQLDGWLRQIEGLRFVA
jgi:hypothetical protein